MQTEYTRGHRRESLSRIRAEVSEAGASLTLPAFDNRFTVMDTTARDAAKQIQDFKLDIDYDILDIDGPMRRAAKIASDLKIPFLDDRRAAPSIDNRENRTGRSGNV
jgi:hypothetical protein